MLGGFEKLLSSYLGVVCLKICQIFVKLVIIIVSVTILCMYIEIGGIKVTFYGIQ